MQNQQKHILAVELPAPCPLACAFCRTPDHGVGDAEQVFAAISARLSQGGYGELYLTSNGETGRSPIFRETVTLAQRLGVPVAVLCATEDSIVPGLVRAEVSVNKFTAALSGPAIAKAKKLGIPLVVSAVDVGHGARDAETLAKEHGADGALIRALQNEGRSRKNAGTTRIWKRAGVELGAFPAAAYAELREIAEEGWAVTCLNPFGTKVGLLGGAVA
ncbi:hypothetical protein HY415_02005 [Candidatus Kaiserbacteria bacterium]|nr:hypothetical protein [Candidatus Kaiserbacteria bacterium]